MKNINIYIYMKTKMIANTNDVLQELYRSFIIAKDKPTEVIQGILKKCENFWINTLVTIYLHGLNQELES